MITRYEEHETCNGEGCPACASSAGPEGKIDVFQKILDCPEGCGYKGSATTASDPRCPGCMGKRGWVKNEQYDPDRGYETALIELECERCGGPLKGEIIVRFPRDPSRVGETRSLGHLEPSREAVEAEHGIDKFFARPCPADAGEIEGVEENPPSEAAAKAAEKCIGMGEV